MNKRCVVVVGLGGVFFCVLVMVLFLQINGVERQGHRQGMDGKTCIECHQELSPQIIVAWQESSHGKMAAGCGGCHGDEKNFNGRPKNDTCMKCHEMAFAQEPMPEKSCMVCHPRHGFRQHKRK